MAVFRYGSVVSGAAKIKLADDGKTAYLNGKGTVRFSHKATEVTISVGEREHAYHSQRSVIEAPNGAKLLPYFTRLGEWFVVMVEQFRIALPGPTLEPAGGEADEADPHVSMARELDEEAHITVRPKDIKIVFGAYIQPSMMRAMAYGGIVKINEAQLPTELMAGEHQFGEYTVVTVHPLMLLLHQRDHREWVPDLETYILLDAVAEAVGLIERRY